MQKQMNTHAFLLICMCLCNLWIQELWKPIHQRLRLWQELLLFLEHTLVVFEKQSLITFLIRKIFGERRVQQAEAWPKSLQPWPCFWPSLQALPKDSVPGKGCPAHFLEQWKQWCFAQQHQEHFQSKAGLTSPQGEVAECVRAPQPWENYAGCAPGDGLPPLVLAQLCSKATWPVATALAALRLDPQPQGMN